MSYNLAEIIKLIQKALSDNDLQDLCLGSFYQVYNTFTQGQDKRERIRKLVDYAYSQGEIPNLIQEIKSINPNTYAEFLPRLEKQDTSDPKQYALAIAQSTALQDQMEEVTNVRESVKLQNLLDKTNQEVTCLGDMLDEQERESNIPLRQYSMFTNDLPKIDFSEAMDEIVESLKSFRDSRGDVLLLLQQHLAMAGDLCLRRIQDDLKQATGDFKFYKLGFHSGESLDENGLLNQLAGHLNLVQEGDLELLADSIINKICNSVRSGSIIYLEIHKWDDFPFQRTTLSWFIQKFWIPLVTRLDDRAKYARVKFVAVIVVDSELSPDCFESPCLCELDKHNLFRWLKLTLRNWTQEEIQEWLETYPGIGNPSSNSKAKNIFSGSLQGIPSLVRQKLEQDLILN